MEANFFRFLAAELGTFLVGRRIDKVFEPAPGVWTLKLQNKGDPLHLLYRPAKSAGHLFVSTVKPANPSTATAMAMWFRKRLRNRKIIGWHVDWPNLRLAMQLTPRNTPPCGPYLILDIRTGLEMVDTLPGAFCAHPEWPALEDVLHDNDVWREYPQISPPLRTVLAGLPEVRAHRLYLSVIGGEVQSYHLPRTKAGWQPPIIWPAGDGDTFETALDAANAYGERTLFTLLDMEEERPTRTLLKRERKKIRRNLNRLEEEKARLDQLAAEKVKGEALQAELYRIKDFEKLDAVEVVHPEHGPMIVPLNEHLTPIENMERYFKLAAKAERGFAHIRRRRRELMRQLESLESGELPETAMTDRVPTPQGPPSLPKRYKGLAVSLFRSSDGFTIIRGKNKKANHDILSKAASPFDLWFHLADGPSSHVILKRDHPDHEVPEQSLTEAAVLCGLKSHRSDDGKADIIYALVKDVRKVKGMAHGQVMVDQTLGTLRVTLDHDLETRLK